MKNVPFLSTEIRDGFWKYYQDLNRTVTVRAVYDRFQETGRFDALKCSWTKGQPNRPHIFWDSDVAKWIEGAAYILQGQSEPELETIVDELVARVAKNQRADGYFNSYYLTIDPGNEFTGRERHELYCTGHWIEAAIAYHRATGKDTLLQCMLKNIDYIYEVFVVRQSAAFVTPGHQEIELALLKLYDYLGNVKHLELARFFLNNRGNNDKEQPDPQITAHMPVREMRTAVGHSVRAGYLYTAMAMLAKADNDAELKTACLALFEDIVNRKMAITGGVGAEHSGERFSYPYDLPNSDTYNETCAAIALALFCGAMQELDTDSRYSDVIERIYFNGFLSGVSLDGDKFFYTNPLEIDQKKYQRSTYQPISQRVKVFGCSCCPPNVVRMLASIPRYAYAVAEGHIYCNQFISGSTVLEVNGQSASLELTTNYPCDGRLHFAYHGPDVRLHVRIPAWCVEYTGPTHKGYAEFDLTDGAELTVDLPMEVHFVEANPDVQDNAGRCAVTRGPIVYCMEGVDNGENLRDITLLDNGTYHIAAENFPAPVIYMEACRRPKTERLYYPRTNRRQKFTAKLIPYFAFGNRGATDMLVWAMVQ